MFLLLKHRSHTSISEHGFTYGGQLDTAGQNFALLGRYIHPLTLPHRNPFDLFVLNSNHIWHRA